MVVEFISCPMPKICDQAGAQTYNPGSEEEKKTQKKKTKKKTTTTKKFKTKHKKTTTTTNKQINKRNRRNTECVLLHDGMPFISYM